MFGFQRVGDLVWAAGDLRARGFLLGGTAGRTTLNGEGLQHQDGHSHLLAMPLPNLLAYDPAYAYEIATIIREGIRRMYEDGEEVFYYLTLGNENYPQPPMPQNVEQGILKGMYRFRSAEGESADGPRAQLLGSGAILNHVLEAQTMLAERFGIAADVWSVTSYKELYRDALSADRWNMLHPAGERRSAYVSECFGDAGESVFVAASDYMKALPEMIAKWLPGRLVSLGTDGFGRSESREALRDHFEVDARFVTLATLHTLAEQGRIERDVVAGAIKELDINPDKLNPMYA
jgi:pyruvate dehydrogenase E1 component